MNEIYIVQAGPDIGGGALGPYTKLEVAREVARRSGGKVEKYTRTHYTPGPEGFVGKVSMDGGTATFEDGTYINLLEVQATINAAFQEHGDPEYADAADTLSKITGLVQGPHGEWEEA